MVSKRKIIVSEELSPYNIALVLLIRIYISNLLPVKKGILYFLVQHLEGKPLQHNTELLAAPDLSNLCDAILQLNSSRYSCQEAKRLRNSRESAVFMLLDLAWSIDTGEEMYRQISDVYALLLDPTSITCDGSVNASPRSVVGRFVQKLVVTARLLHFDETILLFQTFCLFRESSLQLYESLKKQGHQKYHQITTKAVALGPSIGRYHDIKSSYDTKEKEAEKEKDADLFRMLEQQLDFCQSSYSNQKQDIIITPITKAYLEALIDSQIQLLEKYGTLTPPELRSIMEQIATPHFGFSSVHNTRSTPYPSYHYFRYLTNLHEGNYLGAFDSLHQYFDYMVSQGSKYFYHFALIARASLHQCFGEDQKALDSIEEAISVARENRDNSTLTYILSWLFDFMKEKPDLWVNQTSFQNNNELQLLEFLTKKSPSVSLLLAAVSFCFNTENLMAKGESSTKIYESLFKALYVSVNDVPTSFVKCCDLASLVWDRLGAPYLSDLYVDIGLSHSSEFVLRRDSLNLKMRKQLALFKREDPDKAINELKSILKDYIANITQHKKLQKLLLVLQIESNLKSGRVPLAWESLEHLINSGDFDEEARLSIIRLRTNFIAANNDISGAINLVSREISRRNISSSRLDLFHSVSLNLLRTSLLIRSGATSRAFSLLVQQMKFAKWTGSGVALMEASIQMVSYLNEILSPKEAFQIGIKLAPAVIRTRDQHLVSSMYYELSRSCCAFLEDEYKQGPLSRKDLFTNFLKFLSLSIAGFKKSLDLIMLTECFRLEQRVAAAGLRYEDEMTSSLPFQNFKKHSKAGLEILKKRSCEACDLGYLNNSKST